MGNDVKYCRQNLVLDGFVYLAVGLKLKAERVVLDTQVAPAAADQAAPLVQLAGLCRT
jgi:hypothetical protein